MKWLLVDTANILFRVAAAHSKFSKSNDPGEQAGLAMHAALNTLNKYYKQFKPDRVAVTFEGPKNWRKEYTNSSKCISGKGYKANRVKDPSMEPFFELIKSFEDLARNHTSLICLSNPRLEGDDVFAGFVQEMTARGDEVIGLSGDRDFAGLLSHDKFCLINPDNGKPRSLIDLCGRDDAKYFMFEKCFRGDPGDNVMSAYPRVQSKRLQKAFSDDFELSKLMNETWSLKDPDNPQTFRVGDLYEENKILMDLTYQPEEIRELIKQTVHSALDNHGKWSFFHFTKFCGQFGLKQIADNSQQFANLFGGVKIKPTEKPLVLEF